MTKYSEYWQPAPYREPESDAEIIVRAMADQWCEMPEGDVKDKLFRSLITRADALLKPNRETQTPVRNEGTFVS